MLVSAFAVILLFQLCGEVISRALGLPLPGPVLGMVALVVALAAVPRLAGLVVAPAQGLLRHLSLLFVPAGVGVIASADLLRDHAPMLAVALVVSTVLAILVGAVTFAVVARLTGGRADE